MVNPFRNHPVCCVRFLPFGKLHSPVQGFLMRKMAGFSIGVKAISTLLIAVLLGFSASVFSTSRLGDDLGVFIDPLLEPATKSSVIFAVNPSYSLLYEKGSYRGLFWMKPFNFRLNINLPYHSLIGFAWRDRFDQNFDIYTSEVTSQSYQFRSHVRSDGGISEANITLSKVWAEFLSTGFAYSALFGSNQELWEFTIINSGYTVADTITYSYSGELLSGGIGLITKRIRMHLYGESGSKVTIKYEAENVTHNRTDRLPVRLGTSLNALLGQVGLNLQIERSFWPQAEFNDPWRFSLGLFRNRNGLRYSFNPLYVKGVVEHNLSLMRSIPITKLGYLSINAGLSVKNRNNLYEITLNPSLQLSFEEIFGLRKK